MWQVEMKAIGKLDELEGNLVREVCINDQDKNFINIGGLEDEEVKLRGTLFRHVEAWEEAGAFALGLIKEGFKLNVHHMPEA